MSQKSQDAIDVLSKVIVDTIDKKLDSASFDKSQTGVVTAVNGNTYTIAVFGSQYNITSDQIFTVGQSVVVTALQGDMKRLVCSPDNVGTMKTVDSKVNVVGDKLSSFIDKDFADTVDRIDQIKDQVDKSFMSWFYDGEPTSVNAPAKDWITEDAKRLHIGDLYYDTTSGFSYEWVFKNNAYSWQKITNSGIQKALENASQAQDTADGKRRVFYDTPSPPYDKGDMWTQGNGGDILVCLVSRTITGSYNRADWTAASKYTDDTVANRAEEKADNAQSSADKANNDLASFKTEYDSDLKVMKEMIESRVTATTYTEDMSGLKERVSSAETKISQNSDAITLRATKEELATAKSDAISSAAMDATSKANTAESNANKKLESYIKVANDKIESKVSKTDFNGKTVSSLINQDENSVKIKASKIELTGAVTINQSGETVIDSDTINNSITEIDGSKITTGTIDAERLNLSGDITMGSNGKIVIGDNVITSDKIAQGTIFKLLWQNDSNAEFAPQDITLSGCAEYSQLLFVFNGYCKTDETKTSNPGEFDETTYIYKYTTRTSLVVPLTYNMRASALLESVYSVFISFPLAAFVNFITSNKNIYSFDLQSGSANSGYRLTTLKWSDSDLCISFDKAVVSTSGLFSSTKTRNDCVVPYQIYGIK